MDKMQKQMEAMQKKEQDDKMESMQKQMEAMKQELDKKKVDQDP